LKEKGNLLKETVPSVLLTLVVVLVAIAVGWQLWSYYMLEPWTRDGRVRADVVLSRPMFPA
jgi:multidrug resistance efflux pump